MHAAAEYLCRAAAEQGLVHEQRDDNARLVAKQQAADELRKVHAERRALEQQQVAELKAAARAYDAAAITHFGDFASLNFPAEQKAA